MKPFEFNKYSSALKQWLRDVLQKHERAYAFQKSKAYSQSLKKNAGNITDTGRSVC